MSNFSLKQPAVSRAAVGKHRDGGSDALRRTTLQDQYSSTRRQYPYPVLTWFWEENRSYLLVFLSTFFGSVMTLFTKLLESGDDGMHPFQIMFVRMAFSVVACSALLYLRKPSEFPFGPKALRWVLIGRGVSGFLGIYGIWTAIGVFHPTQFLVLLFVTDGVRTEFLDLADATVITFLTPSMVAIISAIFLKKPFTGKEQIASVLALLGVVFIARPAMIFGTPPSVATSLTADGHPISQASLEADDTSASERMRGVLLALMSAVGGAGAFLAIRAIGDRASILTTTNYFAIVCTVVTGTTLAVAPLIPSSPSHLHFALAQGQLQWLLLTSITVCGFLTQLLLTAGLGGETRSNKAPAMVYGGMIWTAGFDRWVFGQEIGWSSLIGCALIVGGAVWIVLQPKPEVEATPGGRDIESTAGAREDEQQAAGMLMELGKLEAGPSGLERRSLDVSNNAPRSAAAG